MTPNRIEELSILPVFMRLQGRQVLAIGGTEAMAWKLELVLAAGARPVLVADAVDEEVRALVEAHHIRVLEQMPGAMDFGQFALIVADIEDKASAASLHARALSCGVPINLIDQPEFCTVQFGSIVNRSPVVVGISTDGAAPVLGQAIRRRIEAMLPRELGAWAQLARSLRRKAASHFPLASLRRAWWGRFAESALSGDCIPEEAERLPDFGDRGGHVTLVGAGPGDPDLLTVKAIKALQNADVILFDALVSDEVLDLARREAQRMPVGKRGGKPSCKQEEINRLMIRLAREGKHVVRLKGGDPAIFSRGNEEARALRALGIPVRIVPGITAASAAAANLGLTLTDRALGRQLLFISGHGRNGETASVDWTAIAAGSTTVALYMGRERLTAFARQAIANGASPDLPLSCGASISSHRENWQHTNLAAAAGNHLAVSNAKPTLILIGEVLRGLEIYELSSSFTYSNRVVFACESAQIAAKLPLAGLTLSSGS
ncbi:siroheme synthase CysG [Minwuia sp.]|uniref:siroheme synthase CysG n=1 Tax=Minwuia sp. TaxID=2493630 RepID=UPI003A919F26